MIKLRQSNEVYEQRARVAAALAHPSRQILLEVLRDREMCVADLTSTLRQDQSTVSRHLAVLRSAGLVDRRKSGTLSLFRTTRPGIENCILALDALAAPPAG